MPPARETERRCSTGRVRCDRPFQADPASCADRRDAERLHGGFRCQDVHALKGSGGSLAPRRCCTLLLHGKGKATSQMGKWPVTWVGVGRFELPASSSRSQRARSPTTTLTLADLPRTVRGCPLTSAGVCGGCYSFSYSPAKGRGGGAHGPDITRHGLAARHLWRAMGDAGPVMSGRHSAADGKSCRRAPCAGTNRLPDRPVSPARLVPIDDVGSGIGAGNLPRQRYTPH